MMRKKFWTISILIDLPTVGMPASVPSGKGSASYTNKGTPACPNTGQVGAIRCYVHYLGGARKMPGGFSPLQIKTFYNFPMKSTAGAGKTIYGNSLSICDITDGGNGFPCLVDYDLCAGRGSWLGDQ